MKKFFSIIIPVYNVEKYIRECLDSILRQNYDNYEVLLVCDKSIDKSEDIADEYVKKNKKFKKIFRENTGLGQARNIGIDNVSKSDYILFLDGDDFLEDKLFETLNKSLKDNPDLLRFQVQDIYDNDKIIHDEEAFDITDGIEAFKKIVKYHYIENSWCYAYKVSFWKENNFKFMPKCIAEDYGLTPLIIAKAKTVKSISYIGYNYRQRENSLMNNNDYSKKIKKMDDMLLQATFLKGNLKNISDTNVFMRYINNSLIYQSTKLNKIDCKRYNRILKDYKCFDYLPDKTIKNKIKKMLIKNCTWFYYHHLVRNK